MRAGQSLQTSLPSPIGFDRVDTVMRTWANIQVHHDEKYPASGQSWVDMRSPRTNVVIRLEQKGGVCEPRFRLNEPAHRRRCDIGFFNWIPPDQKVWCFSDNARFVRDLRLTFDIASVQTAFAEEYGCTRLHEPHLIVYDSRVARCAQLLAQACTVRLSNERLYAESMTTALLAAVLEAIGNQPEQKPLGALAAWQLRIAKEYLADHCRDEVSFETLAERLGLSRSRLTRGFKAATGMGPYAWMMHVRVEQAKGLLLRNRTRIVDAALDLGFADQSHFTKVFKRFTGVTPREFQRPRFPGQDS